MFLDPEYTNNKTVTLGKITKMITKEFETPVMVKRNSGTQKRNVFLCQSEKEIKQALKKIFSKKQLEYDHVALAQGYIQPSMELRVVVYQGEVEFWYPTKGYTESNWLKEEVNTITNISQEVAKGLGATLMGIDLIKDKEGEWWFIEANANPIFSGFMRRNPTSKAVYFLYRKILFSLKNRYQLV